MLLLVHSASFGQRLCDLEISGEIRDEHNLEALAFAEVVIQELGRGVVADSSGEYRIAGLCAGTYTLVASHIGCEPVTQVVKLKASRNNVNFYPEHHSQFLSEATIVGEKRESQKAAQVKVRAEDIELAKGKTIAEAIESVSGASVLKTGNTIVKPVIHGLFGNRIVTLNNGVRQEDQQWGLEHGLNIDLFNAENISVLKGAAAVQYGTGAVGGVLKVDPAPLPFNENYSGRLYLIGQSNGRGGSSAFEIGKGFGDNFAIRAQASAKKLGDLSAPDYLLTNTASEELNASLSAGYKFAKGQIKLYLSHYGSELGILAASHIGNLSDLKNAIESGQPLIIDDFDYVIENPRQKLSHDLVKLKANYRLSPKNELSATYAYQFNQRREYDIRRGGRSEIPANFLQLKTHTVNLTLQSQRSGRWNSSYGIQSLIQENTNVPGTGIRPILPNYNTYQVGIFGLEEYERNRWKYELGLRYGFQHTQAQKYSYRQKLIKPIFNYANIAATGGLSYRFSENVQLSSLLAYAYRAPHINELLSEGLHHGAASIEEGDSNLIPEKSLNWSNTLSLNFNQVLEVDITAYANPFWAYIYLEPQPELRLSIRGAFPVFQYKQTDALLSGVDLSARWKISEKWRYLVNASYLRGFDLSDNTNLVLIPPGTLHQALGYAFSDWNQIRDIYLEGTHDFKAYQNFYPRYQSEIPELFRPPSAYNLFGLRAGFSIPFKDNRTLSCTLSAENIFNTPYRNYLNRLRYYADDTGRNFSIQVKYQF